MRRRTAFIVVLGIVAVLLLYQFSPSAGTVSLPPGTKLAVWMGVTWSMDAHSDSEIAALAADLQAHRVDYAYIYVSYLQADDSFRATYEQAAAFTRRLRALAPDITLFAWVGVPIAITQPDGTVINNRLERASIRQQIVDFAADTITDLGFDGFHLNAELIPSEDEAFLQTLAAIRDALPAGTRFSTTAHALRPQGLVTLVPYPQVAHHWTPAYLQQVADRIDQIALMAYDSGLPFPRDYRAWVEYQTRTAGAALVGKSAELLIGLPVSEEWTWSHQTQAETLAAALSGLGAGYSETVAGVALYPYWEIDSDKWRQVDAIRR